MGQRVGGREDKEEPGQVKEESQVRSTPQATLHQICLYASGREDVEGSGQLEETSRLFQYRATIYILGANTYRIRPSK